MKLALALIVILGSLHAEAQTRGTSRSGVTTEQSRARAAGTSAQSAALNDAGSSSAEPAQGAMRRSRSGFGVEAPRTTTRRTRAAQSAVVPVNKFEKVELIALQRRALHNPSQETLERRDQMALREKVQASANSFTSEAGRELAKLAWNQPSFMDNNGKKTQLETLATRLSEGFNIDEKDASGRTLYMHAAISGHQDLQWALLRAGANVNLRDQDGRTASELATAVQLHKNLKSNLWYVEKYFTIGDRYVADEVWAAFRARDFATLGTLIEQGAYVDTFDLGIGKSLLSYAADKNDIEMMRFLLARGANPTFGNRDSEFNQYPVTSAAGFYQYDAIELLIANGASINGKGSYGYELNTVRQAVWNASFEANSLEKELAMLDWLLSRGANPDANLTAENLERQKSFKGFVEERLGGFTDKARAPEIRKVLKKHGIDF